MSLPVTAVVGYPFQQQNFSPHPPSGVYLRSQCLSSPIAGFRQPAVAQDRILFVCGTTHILRNRNFNYQGFQYLEFYKSKINNKIFHKSMFSISMTIRCRCFVTVFFDSMSISMFQKPNFRFDSINRNRIESSISIIDSSLVDCTRVEGCCSFIITDRLNIISA